jgi:hypothetical protein
VNVLQHPYWATYGVIASALLGLLLSSLAQRSKLSPNERAPMLGYAVGAVMVLLWPVFALLIVLLVLAD